MKTYDLHKHGIGKLQVEQKDMEPFFLRNQEKATKAHRHSFFQVLWFRTEGQHFIDYEVISHPANAIFLVHPHQIHYFCPDSANQGLIFHFNDSFITKHNTQVLSRFSISIFNQMGDGFLWIDDRQAAVLEGLAETIRVELGEKMENHSEIIFHQFLSFLYQIERIKKEQSPFDLDKNSDFGKVARFKEMIVNQIDQHKGIDDYAAQLNLTPKKLTQLTKQFTQRTPANLIQDLKILEAKRMLSNQHISVKEVAYALGYDQPTYFTKVFKKATSLPPKKFQQSLR